MILSTNKKDWDVIVLTSKGWDGSRILGVFLDLESAKKEIINNITPINNRKTPPKEEAILDFVKIGKSCKSIFIEFNCDPSLSDFEVTFRYHETSDDNI